VGSAGSTAVPAVALAGLLAAGETPLQLTSPLVWVMLGLTVAGAVVTYAFLVYAVWRFRDRTMKGRRHG
jgi:amino acid transporter